jgi:hypothetical protein
LFHVFKSAKPASTAVYDPVDAGFYVSLEQKNSHRKSDGSSEQTLINIILPVEAP